MARSDDAQAQVGGVARVTATLDSNTTALPAVRAAEDGHSWRSRSLLCSAFALCVICSAFVLNTLRIDENRNPFQDEGLYLFMGHRMIDHVLSGVQVTEYPGSYFSGAPGFYPVVGALADSVGGVPASRLLSLSFVCVAVIASYGIGKELFGNLSGLL